MIKNPEKLQAFEAGRIKAEKVDVMRNYELLDAMVEEARSLGAFPAKDPMEGIELKIKIARVVNSVQRAD